MRWQFCAGAAAAAVISLSRCGMESGRSLSPADCSRSTAEPRDDELSRELIIPLSDY